MNVAHSIVSALAVCGTKVVWGMPGGDSLEIMDALREKNLRFILVRDETSAGFAADASAQLTGNLGCCIATLGPGLTNMITGVVGCTLDRAPVLALTSRYRTDQRATYTHMMFEQEKLLDASAKAWFRVTAANIHGELRKAIGVATAPRQGAVWLEVPTEVANAECESHAFQRPVEAQSSPVSAELLAAVCRLKRPVLLVGFSARHEDIALLANSLRAPVITSYKAKGAISEGQGFSAGAAGLSAPADRVHQQLLKRADGLLLIGWDPAELRDHWLPGFPTSCEVFTFDDHHVTDLPCAIHHRHCGGAKQFIQQISQGDSLWTLKEIAAHRRTEQAVFDEEVFGPATAVRAIAAAVTDEVVVTLDVGAHRITASHVFKCARPDRLLQSNGFSSMGYGIPAGLAAAAHGFQAVCIVGDMGIQMVLGELMLVREQQLTLVVVVFDDQELSLISLKQRRLGNQPHGVQFTNPNWCALAEAFGGQGQIVTEANSLTTAVQQALNRTGLSIIAARIDRSQYHRQM